MTERLRIAVLSRNFSTTGGGAERYSIALVEQLAARHEVHVFAQTIAHEFPGVTYHQIPMPTERPRWINQLYFAWKTWRATRTGFDVVHSHENSWHGNVQTVHVLPVKHTLFAGQQGAALVLRWLKVLTSPRLLAYLWLEKRRYAWALKKKVVCASSSLKEVVQKVYPGGSSMLEVVSPGVDSAPGRAPADVRAQSRQDLGLAQGSELLLFVGNDLVKKGLPTLLQAMAQLPPSVHLAVVGQGDHTLAMQLAAKPLGARVCFLGALQDVTPAYRAADVLVHPTLEDSYGMVVLEAMAHGLPVVVSDAAYCGIAQDLRDGENALLLKDPTDVAQLVTALSSLLGNREVQEHLSVSAQAFAQTHTWGQAAGAYESQYQKIGRRCTQRWLVLAHAFNMDGRAASQTITDKLPHLNAAGIELVVLSGVSGRKDRQYEHHQLWPAGPAGIRFELRHVLRKHFSNPLVYRLVMVLLSIPLLPFMLVEKLLRRVESSWSWWLSAYVVGRLLARHRKFDLIYSTGGAFAAHVAGHALKRALGVRWLAEVHDPLVMPGSEPHTPQERMQAEVERLICNDADVAIWFTDQALASAKRRHPQLGARGQMMLPGIDAPFNTLPPYVPGPKMVIGHFGSLSSTRNLTPIIAALEAVVVQHPEARGLVELQVTGGPLDQVSESCVAQSPVRDMVRHLGRIEADPVTGLSGRAQILRRMRSADVLLLLHGTEPICAEYIPSKMYEYLWMQRPILATVHRNPQMAALLRGQGHMVVETQDTSAQVDLTLVTLSLLERWQGGGLADNGLTSPYTTQAAVHALLNSRVMGGVS
ncbi:MAG: glycosyltransferase [Rhodoferax sp.]|nr:MAG: glycosyltransferase [Rhodoferax sp.]